MGLFDFFRKASSAAPASTSGTYKEIGVTGLHVATGYVYEEFLLELSGDRGRRVFREMSDNDATVGAIILSIDALLRAIKWDVEPNENDTDGTGSEWLKAALADMDHSWEAFISELLSMLTFGFSYHEIVYKKRDDGTIGIAKLSPRSQESLLRWEMSPNGDVLGFHQQDPNGGPAIYIPIEKALHFRTTFRKNNPEGRSILRNAYTSWYYKKQIQILEAIAIERELAGLPVIRVPSEILTNPDMASVLQKYQRLARDLKFNDQGGVILPSDTYKDDTGRPSSVRQFEIELMSASGSRAIDMNSAIVRYQQDIARTILADFLILGSASRGSFALSKSKTDLFLRSLEGYTSNIASELNKSLIPKLWKLNGFPDETRPTIVPGQVAPTDLEELGNYISKLAGAGIVFGGDPETEKKLRQAADLPGEYVGGGMYPNDMINANQDPFGTLQVDAQQGAA